MKRMIICLICAIVVLNLGGCCIERNPPDIKAVNKLFSKNKEEIDTVVSFMANAEQETIIINDSNGTMHADFETVEIPDHNAQKAIEHLIKKDVVIEFYKKRNRIQLKIWMRREVRCWIAYSTNGTVPDVQYATEVIAMEKDDWYYVIADYNEWRSREIKTEDSSLS